MAPCLLAADGGGTYLRVALCALDGRVLGIGGAGVGNVLQAGVEALVRETLAAASQAHGGLPLPPVERACLALAGARTPALRGAIAETLAAEGLCPGERIEVTTDLRAALTGGLLGEPGIVVVAGTGSAAYGEDASGKAVQSGGWGPHLDDGGGAAWMVTRALQAVVRGQDGRGRKTALAGYLFKALGLVDWAELPMLFAPGGRSRAEFAAHAHWVTRAAREGDPAAKKILYEGAYELAHMAVAVLRQLDLPTPRAAITGGVTGDGAYMAEITSALREVAPTVEPVFPELQPLGGALLLAAKTAGAGGPAFIRQLDASWRPAWYAFAARAHPGTVSQPPFAFSATPDPS